MLSWRAPWHLANPAPVRALPDQTVVRRSSFHELQLAATTTVALIVRRAKLSLSTPPSDQAEEQARFECMRLVRAGDISDAELLRLREQPLPWRAVLDRMHERRTDNAVRALELLARQHTFT